MELLSQKKEGGGPTPLQLALSTAVLVIGVGVTAWTAARELTGRGHRVVLLGSEAVAPSTGGVSGPENGITVWAPARIIDFAGFPGAFHVRARLDGGRHVEAEVGAVVVAADCRLFPPFHAWGLEPSEQVLSLCQLEETLISTKPPEAGSRDGSETHILICGFTHPSHPLSQKRAMEAALQLAEKRRTDRVIFLLEHSKVADTGLERLSRRAREAGVLFAKLTGASPEVTQLDDRIRVSYDDEALGERVFLHPDRVVLEEAYAPPPHAAQLAALLDIHTDAQGFFQGDNVANQPIFTNRTGIWVAGQAKGPVSEARCVEEACAAAQEASRLLDPRNAPGPEDRVVLNTRKCAICLTCYRLCPHRAISYVNRRPVFSSLACRSCGICVAECPMDAIQLNGVAGDGMDARLRESVVRASKTGNAAARRIVAFCCRNSAYEAAQGARAMGAGLPEGLDIVQVPCAGNVDLDDLLKAFRYGAAGVIVLACHHDSCKSVDGSRLARWRVQAAGQMLKEAGVSAERLLFGTLAPATPMDFAAAARDMERRLKGMKNE